MGGGVYFWTMPSEGRAEKVNLARLPYDLVSIFVYLGQATGEPLLDTVVVVAVLVSEIVERDVHLLISKFVSLSTSRQYVKGVYPRETHGDLSEAQILYARDCARRRERMSHTRSWHI